MVVLTRMGTMAAFVCLSAWTVCSTQMGVTPGRRGMRKRITVLLIPFRNRVHDLYQRANGGEKMSEKMSLEEWKNTGAIYLMCPWLPEKRKHLSAFLISKESFKEIEERLVLLLAEAIEKDRNSKRTFYEDEKHV